jgi:hypothetical protein
MHERELCEAREALGPQAFAVHFAEGRRGGADEALGLKPSRL